MLIRRIFFHFVPQNTTDIPYQTRSVEFLKPPKQANSEYPQNIKNRKLPVSDNETDSFLLWDQTDYNMADDDMWIVS